MRPKKAMFLIEFILIDTLGLPETRNGDEGDEM
jgi:hypothetical protein